MEVGGGDSFLEQSFGVSTDTVTTISAPLGVLAAGALLGSRHGLSECKQVPRSVPLSCSPSRCMHACLCCLNALMELRCVLLHC